MRIAAAEGSIRVVNFVTPLAKAGILNAHRGRAGLLCEGGEVVLRQAVADIAVEVKIGRIAGIALISHPDEIASCQIVAKNCQARRAVNRDVLAMSGPGIAIGERVSIQESVLNATIV